jgi:hypothetical protein
MRVPLFLTVAALAVAAAATPALAGSTQVASRAALGGNDLIDWGQLAPSIAVLTNPVDVTSTGGLGAVVNGGGGNIFTDQQGNPWDGNFAPGDFLIGTGQVNAAAPIDITFAHPVSGFGAQMGYNLISGAPVAFTEEIKLFDVGGGMIADYTATGEMDTAADNSAVFIGALDTTADIARVEFSTPTTGIGGVDGSFAINQVSLVDSVPEPATWAMMMLGFGSLGAKLRASKRRLATVRI